MPQSSKTPTSLQRKIPSEPETRPECQESGQTDAQCQYRELTRQKGREARGLPKDFAFRRAKEAEQRCFVVGDSMPDVNTQEPNLSTTTPHLLGRLGLLDR